MLLRIQKLALLLVSCFFFSNSFGMEASLEKTDVLQEAAAKKAQVIKLWVTDPKLGSQVQFHPCELSKEIGDFLTAMNYAIRDYIYVRTGPNLPSTVHSLEIRNADKKLWQALTYLLQQYKVQDLFTSKPLSAYVVIADICHWVFSHAKLISACTDDSSLVQRLQQYEKTHHEEALVLKNKDESAHCAIASGVARFFPIWASVEQFRDACLVSSANTYDQASLDFFKILLYALYAHALNYDQYALKGDYHLLERRGIDTYVQRLKNLISSYYHEEVDLLQVLLIAHEYNFRVLVQAILAAWRELDYESIIAHIDLAYFPMLMECEQDQYRIFDLLNAKVTAITGKGKLTDAEKKHKRELTDAEKKHIEDCIDLLTNDFCRNICIIFGLGRRSTLHPLLEQILKKKLFARYVPLRARKIADFGSYLFPMSSAAHKSRSSICRVAPMRADCLYLRLSDATGGLLTLKELLSPSGDSNYLPTLHSSFQRVNGDYLCSRVPGDLGSIWVDQDGNIQLKVVDSDHSLCLVPKKHDQELRKAVYFEQDLAEDKERKLVVCARNDAKESEDMIRIYSLGLANAPISQARFIQNLEQTRKRKGEEFKNLLVTPQGIVASFYEEKSEYPNILRLWDSRTYACKGIVNLPKHGQDAKWNHEVLCMSVLSQDCIAVGAANVVYVCDLAKMQCTATLEPKSYRMLSEAVTWVASINKDHIAVGHKANFQNRGFINIWNLVTKKLVKTLYRHGPAFPVHLSVLSPNTMRVLYSDGVMYQYYIRECAAEDDIITSNVEDVKEEATTLESILTWFHNNAARDA